MKRTVVLWVAGMLIFAAVLAIVLTTDVYGDRGRDEINLLSIHEISISTGMVVTQPVPLQREAPYAIDLPYRWLGANPARVEARLMTSDGSLLAQTVEALGNTQLPFWLQPTGDGSFLEDNTAAFHPIRLPPSLTGTVVLRLTRVDSEPGTLVFFASDRVSGSRPTMLTRPGEILAVQTEYGAPRPVLAKTSVYVSRIQSLAPPWLPFPMPELLLVVIAAAGIFLFTKMMFWPADEPPAEVLSSTRSR